MAGHATLHTPEVNSAERWALFSIHPTFHKITGHFNEGVFRALNYSAALTFLLKKHKSTSACMCKLTGARKILQQTEQPQTGFHRKNHTCLATNVRNFVSPRPQKITSITPTPKILDDSTHVHHCPASSAQSFLSLLIKHNTLIQKKATLEAKLSNVFDIP